jgi:hypothetical protein
MRYISEVAHLLKIAASLLLAKWLALNKFSTRAIGSSGSVLGWFQDLQPLAAHWRFVNYGNHHPHTMAVDVVARKTGPYPTGRPHVKNRRDGGRWC